MMNKRLLSLLLCLLLFAFSVRCEEDAADAAPAGSEEHDMSSDTEKMLQLITSSLYTSREVFLRETVSNSADALQKRKTHELKDPTKRSDTPFEIKVSFDKESRTLVIQDSGIGMSKEDMIQNLGSLGASGTKKFLEGLSATQSTNFIGQFGVGFYSVFLVADKVRVASRQAGSDVQWVWQSTGNGKYLLYKDPRGVTITEGTEISLELKGDAEEFLDSDKNKNLIQKFSEFVDWPIYVEETKTEKVPKKKEEAAEGEEKKEGEDDEAEVKDEEEEAPEDAEEEMEEVTTSEWKLVNENKPIWLRKQEDVTDKEYNEFYKAITKEYEDPLDHTHFRVEGEVDFRSILYVPNKAPYNLFDYTQGSLNNVRLYVRRVFITDEFKDLLPRYLNFIRGVVDSDDLPLNVSREVLQESRLLKIIKKKLVRKALQMITDIAKDDEEKAEKKKEQEEKKKAEDAEKKEDEEKKEEDADEDKKDDDEEDLSNWEPRYPKLWENFGKSLRLGLIEDSSNRARLTKLLRYKTSKSDGKFISMQDYVDRMPEAQTGIFFLVGESIEKIKASPLLEKATAKDVEIIYMDDAIDEYVVGHMTEYSGKKLFSLAKSGATFFTQTKRDEAVAKARAAAWEPFTKYIKATLGDKIEKAVVSDKVDKAPAILVSPEYGMTATMENIMKAQALSDGTQARQTAKRIMEINPRHPIIDELRRRFEEDDDEVKALCKDTITMLYDVSALQTGFSMDDPNNFATRVHRVLRTGLNLDQDTGLLDEEEYEVEGDDEEEEGDDEEGDEEEGDEEEGEEGEGEAEEEPEKDEL
eukprot:TRINITY_DN48495_c0_g1_i1.p1 TRINITY_DN48495_c0_g1~~TRINITY_DN48495_c0_g1_i1.p1  ORF type:complete len:809 (+),score=237.65 TRINITY_DN48495_c0_g1_i1:109-2535(+)